MQQKRLYLILLQDQKFYVTISAVMLQDVDKGDGHLCQLRVENISLILLIMASTVQISTLDYFLRCPFSRHGVLHGHMLKIKCYFLESRRRKFKWK